MSLNGFDTTDLKSPRGAWTDLAQVEVRPDRAFSAINMRFRPGRGRTRDGYAVEQAVIGKVTSMYQWITSAFNMLIYYESATLNVRNLTTGTLPVGLMTLAGRGVSVAEAGDKAYVTVYSAAGLGAGQAVCILMSSGAPIIVGTFKAPRQELPVITDNGAGLTTPGNHYFGYLIESATGFPGSPSPVWPTGVFRPFQINVGFGLTGPRIVRMSITIPAIGELYTIYPIMTRSDNPNRWFYIPGLSATWGGGSPLTAAFNISIGDEDLAATASSADPNFAYLTQSQSGSGPFNPSVLIPYNRRICYVVNDKVYVSDIDWYEVVTEDRHVIQVPGKRRIITGFPLRGSLYLLGPGWTCVSTDDGNDPRQWPVPQEVSSAIGTLSPTGVEWRTAGDYAWVAAESGLWLFNGQYAEKPISYQNSDFWRRINWAYPASVQVRENIKEQSVYVAAPLDGATEPSHILIWNFGMGMEPFTVDFSYDFFLAGTFSSICLVQDPTTGAVAMWRGPSAAGFIQKQIPGLHSDNGAAIQGTYYTGFLLEDMPGIKRVGAVELSVDGAGTLLLAANGKDGIAQAIPPAITLSAAPGMNYRQRFSLNDENVALVVYTIGVGHHFDIQSIRTYWKPYLRNR